jgi:hypothetical protein
MEKRSPIEQRRRRRPSRPVFNRLLSQFLDWRVIGGAFLVAICISCMAIAIFWLTRPDEATRAQATAILNIIAADTPTEPVMTDNPGALATESALPTPPPGVVAIGAYVQVIGTGGTGLRLRDQPGLGGQVLMLGSEAEVFRVEDGPKDVDGYTWWYLVGPFDNQRRGWAVVNYLQVVKGP